LAASSKSVPDAREIKPLVSFERKRFFDVREAHLKRLESIATIVAVRVLKVEISARIVGISVCSPVRKLSRPKIAIIHHSFRPLIGGSETQTLCAGFVSQPPSLALFDFLRSGSPIGHLFLRAGVLFPGGNGA